VSSKSVDRCTFDFTYVEIYVVFFFGVWIWVVWVLVCLGGRRQDFGYLWMTGFFPLLTLTPPRRSLWLCPLIALPFDDE
jgi:hypothetical protein